MWTLVSDFHIEKSRLRVIVVDVDGGRISGDLFVAGSTRNASGHEEAPDVLNAPEPFFPLATPDGRVLLCAKSHVRELLVPREDVTEPDWAIGARAHVSLTLVGGARYQGTLYIAQDSGHQRVLDYLNRLNVPFIQLYTAEGVAIVNRTHVVHVEQVA